MKIARTLMAASSGLFPLVWANAAEKKPNIFVILGDDIGTWNYSFWSRGMMGYQTPGSFNLTKIEEQLKRAGASNHRTIRSETLRAKRPLTFA